jgi:hypothetical protein
MALALTWIYNKDYGFGHTNDGSSSPVVKKNEAIAIPYQAVDTPSNGSEFTDPILNLVLTAFAYMHDVMAGQRMMQKVERLLDMEYAQHSSWELFTHSEDMDVLVRDLPNKPGGYDTFRVERVVETAHLQRNPDSRCAITRILLLRYIYPTYLRFNTRQLNASFVDIAHAGFVHHRVGFSGTVHVPRPACIPNQNDASAHTYEHADDVSNGGMQSALLGLYNPKGMRVHRLTAAGGGDLLQLLQFVIVQQDYDVLIDAGALFRDWNAERVARTACHLLRGRKHVIFVDTSDRLSSY